jgi:hypothetical protein
MLDVTRRRDDEARLTANVSAQRLHERVVERIAHRDSRSLVVGSNDKSAVAPCKWSRKYLRRELRIDLQRIEIDKRQPDVRRNGLHDCTLIELQTGIARLRKPECREDLGGVHSIIRTETALSSAHGTLSQ